MTYEFRTRNDLADFLERLLRNQLEDRWEIDDFESLSITQKKDERWILELWRHCILDVAAAKNPPEGHWMHPDARPHIERLMETLRYIEESRSNR